MANDKSAAVFVLLLAFLFLLTAPIVLVIGYYSGILPPFLIDLFLKKVMQLPQVDYRSIAAAAAAGLFIIPVLLVFLAVVIAAVKRRGLAVPSASVAKEAIARQAPARYPWEGMFGAEEREHKEKRRAVSKPPSANFKAAAAVITVIVIVALVLLLANMTKPARIADASKTAVANVTAADTSPVVSEEKQNVFSRILAQAFVKPRQPQRNLTTVSLSGAAKKVLGSAKSFGGKIKSRLVSSASSLKSRISKVSDAVWQKIAIAAVALLAVGAVFYSHRTGQLGGILKWLREWLGWLAAISAAARRNWLRVLLGIIFAAIVCAAAAAVIFRKWLIAKFPTVSASGMADAAANALLAVKDFISVYRIYILIGIFALLALIGILVALEKKGRG